MESPTGKIEVRNDRRQAKDRADQYVAADQWISETSAQHAAPRNYSMRPPSSHKRLKRQVDHPKNTVQNKIACMREMNIKASG